MTLSASLRPDFYRILNVVEGNAARRAALAKIETTVMCMDALEHANRRLGQINRRAMERLRRG